MNRAAQQVWDKLAPVQTPDLQTYVEAIGGMFQEADDYASDSVTGQIGWSGLLDLSRVPDKGLDWLAQFIGVHFPASLSAAAKRTRIQSTDGWNRGTVAAIAAAARQSLTGSKTVIIRERFPDAYSFQVLTKRSETPVEDWGATNLTTNGGLETNIAGGWSPGGTNTFVRSTARSKYGIASGLYTIVNVGVAWLFSALTALSGPTAGSTYTASIWFYGEGSMIGRIISWSLRETGGASGDLESTQNFVVAPGWQRVSVTRTLVANDRTALLPWLGFGGAANGDYCYVDGAQTEAGATATPYIETDGAIASRAVGSGPIGAALREQKPAGLIMTYSVIDGNDYQSLVTNHALYSNVFADYATYQGVLNDAPGT